MENVLQDGIASLTREFTWEYYLFVALQSAVSATAYIWGGLAGWFAGAGRRSFVLAGGVCLMLPILVWGLAFLANPLGVFSSVNWLWYFKNAAASYAGFLIPMLSMFFIFRRARIGWRGRFNNETEASK